MSDNLSSEKKNNNKPPIFKTWSAWYWLVIGNLALLVLLFYLFTKAYQ